MKTLNFKHTGLLTFALGATLVGAAQAQGGFNDNFNNNYNDNYNDSYVDSRNDGRNNGRNRRFGDTPRLVLNGRPFETRIQPVVQDGRVLVPLRDIFENLGARVDFDRYNQTISARRDGSRVQMKLGSQFARVNGRDVRLDVPAVATNGATLVPLRFVSEALGAQVNFNERRNVVRINDNDGRPGNDGRFGRNRGRA